MSVKYFFNFLLCFFSFIAFDLFAQITTNDHDRWKKELYSKLIIEPEFVFYFGEEYFFKEFPNLKEKENYWAKECNKEELFICKLKKIIETVNLQTPFYVSPEAGNTVILYRKAIENTGEGPMFSSDPLDSDVLNPPVDFCIIYDLFRRYSKKYGLLFYLTDYGVVVLSKKDSEKTKQMISAQGTLFPAWK